MIEDVIAALKPLADFQTELLNISESSTEKAAHMLESITGLKISSIVNSFISLAQVRPQSIKYFPNVIESLKSKEYKEEIINELMKLAFFVNSDDGYFEQDIIPLVLVKSLADAGIADIKIIIEKIKLVQASYINHIQLFFLFFRKHIQKFDQGLYSSLSSVDPRISCGWLFNTRFGCILDSLDSDYDYVFEVGYPRNSIEAAIKLDDIKAFIEFSAVENFNFNSDLSYDAFCIGDSARTKIPALAAHYGSIQIFKYCVINKYELTDEVTENAIFGGNLEIIHILEHEGVSFFGSFAPAAASQRLEILDWIMHSSVSQNLNLENEIENAAVMSAKTGSANSMIFCFENGAKITPDIINETLNRTFILQALVKSTDVDLNGKNIYGWSPICEAAGLGYVEAFDILMSTGRIDISRSNPQCVAAEAGRMEILRKLKEIPNINWNAQKQFTLQTPLMVAAENGRADVVKFLLEIDSVDPNCVSSQDNTALHIAAIAGNLDVIKILVECPRVNTKVRGFRAKLPSELARTDEIANYLRQFE